MNVNVLTVCGDIVLSEACTLKAYYNLSVECDFIRMREFGCTSHAVKLT
jgi:hypothetical protein